MKVRSYQELENARKFLESPRGCYIVGQALYKAIEQMSAVPKEQREKSNIEDMKYLMDTLFPIFKMLKEAEEELKKNKKKLKGE